MEYPPRDNAAPVTSEDLAAAYTPDAVGAPAAAEADALWDSRKAETIASAVMYCASVKAAGGGLSREGADEGNVLDKSAANQVAEQLLPSLSTVYDMDPNRFAQMPTDSFAELGRTHRMLDSDMVAAADACTGADQVVAEIAEADSARHDAERASELLRRADHFASSMSHVLGYSQAGEEMRDAIQGVRESMEEYTSPGAMWGHLRSLRAIIQEHRRELARVAGRTRNALYAFEDSPQPKIGD